MPTTPDGIFNEIIDSFFGGMSDDPRIQKTELFQMAQHFDIWTEPKRLTPYPANIPDDTFTNSFNGNSHQNSTTAFEGDVVAATDVFTMSATLASLGITNGTGILYTGPSHDVFVINTTYYVGNISGSTCKLYADSGLTTLKNATVDTVGMTFSITVATPYVSTSGTPESLGITSGAALTYTGSTAGGLVNGQTYYAGDITSTKFRLYNDSGLTTPTTISADVNPAAFTVAIAATGYKIEAFAYDNSTFWGAGRKAGTTKVKIFQKASSDSIDGYWYGAPNGEDSENNGGNIEGFLAYHNYLYFGKQTGVGAWGQTSPSGTMTSTAKSAAAVACQGIITSDDLLIFPTAVALLVKDGAGSGPTDVWSTPISFSATGRAIKDLCEWGDFVAIALHPSGGFPANIGSRVALWDKVSADPSHNIDWGEGHLLMLENLEGTLVGASVVGYGEEGIIKQKLVIRQYTGGDDAQVIFELEADAGTTMTIQSNKTKVRDSNRVMFGVQFTKDGVSYFQNAAIGRKSAGYPLAFTMDRRVDNTTAITALNAQYKLGQTIFSSFNSDFSLNKTDGDLTYSTSTYTSQKITGAARGADAARRMKRLLMAGVVCPKLPSGGAISLYYRIDGATSWTLIRTYTQGDDTTAGIVPADMGFEAGSVGTSNDEFPNFRELEFQAICTGGASITGIPYAWQFSGATISSQ